MKGSKTIDLVVSQFVNKQLRRRENIKQMRKKCLNKENMFTKQNEIDNKLTRVKQTFIRALNLKLSI